LPSPENRNMRSLKITFALLVCAVLLGACGLKGPLYLPGEDGQPIPGVEQVPDDDDLTVNKKKDRQSDPG
jgi:predicted small lipoprotein YifL